MVSGHDPTAQNNYFKVFQEIVLIKVCYLVSRQKLLQRHYSSQFFVAFVLNRTCLVAGGHRYSVLAFIQKGFVVPRFRKKNTFCPTIKELRVFYITKIPLGAKSTSVQGVYTQNLMF